MKKIILCLALVVAGYAQSCAPNLARTNARIEKGWQVGGSAGAIVTSKDDNDHEHQVFPFLEADIQHGWRGENNLGIALQLKAPLLLTQFPSLDLYVELPSPDRFTYGVGGEFFLANGAYFIVTYHTRKEYFVSLTGRVLHMPDQTEYLFNAFNPQLSVGGDFRNIGEWAIVSGYHYYRGEGQSVGFNVSEYSEVPGDVKHMIYALFSLRFP